MNNYKVHYILILQDSHFIKEGIISGIETEH